MEPLTRKQWTVAWSLPALFFLAVGIGAILPRMPHRGSGGMPEDSKTINKSNKDWWSDAPPVEVHGKMQYQVSGAGSAGYNGIYSENGTYDGKTAYQLDASHQLFYDSNNACWALAPAQTDFGPEEDYCVTSDQATPDMGTWAALNGASPAPTVVEYVPSDTTPPAYDSDTGASVPANGNSVDVPLTEADSTPVLPATGVTGFTVKINNKEYVISIGTITNVAGEVTGYTISGAGTTGYNGTYTETGTLNSKPQYSKDSSHYLSWILSGASLGQDAWALLDVDYSDDSEVAYWTDGATPDVGTWSNSGFTGSSPVPTVTANTTAASITANLPVPVQIYQHDTVKVKYDSGTGNVTDSAGTPNAMASFGYQSVDNGSTEARTLKKPVVMLDGQLRNLPDNEQLIQPAVAPVQTLTDASTVTWDVSDAPISKAMVTLGGNRTLDVQNAVNGSQGVLFVKQDATGSRTLALPANSKVAGGGDGAITLSTAADAIDAIAFIHDGTDFWWTQTPGSFT